MILLAGLVNDPIVIYLHKALAKTNLPVAFVNQEQLGASIMLDETKIYAIDGSWSIPHSSVQAVFNRLVGCPEVKDLKHERQLEHLDFYLEQIYPNVLNRPSASATNFSKPLQLSMLSLEHIQLPESQIIAGSSPPQATNMIFKSISSVRSIVNKIISHKLPVREPVLFQKQCIGNNIRVHCLGNEYSACELISSDIDYRYGATKINYDYQLPTPIALECLHIMKTLKLEFAGIDLIRNQDSWSILEVNTAPGFAYFEQNNPKKSISNMIINYLTRINNAK